MPPTWLQDLAPVYVPLSILAALPVLTDIVVLGRQHPTAVMDWVWLLTVLS